MAETQNTVRRGVLRAEIEGEILDLGFSHSAYLASPAFSSPGNCA